MKKILVSLSLSILLAAASASAQPAPAASPRWKPPVANEAALPATGNTIGDARVTLDSFAVYVWDGDSWETAASGGGGGGTVTSVDIANATGISFTGGPVVSSGSFTPALSANL